MLPQSQRVWAQPSGIWAWTCLTVRLERMFLQIRPSYNHLSTYQGNITLAMRAKILPSYFIIASLSRNLSLHLCIHIIFFSESFEGKLVTIPIMFIVVSSVTQSCPTLCNPMNCSLPGSSVHGILQARILEWVALLQGIFPTQGLSPRLLHLLHWQVGSSLPFSPLRKSP